MATLRHRYSSSSMDISHLSLDDDDVDHPGHPSGDPDPPEPQHMGTRKVKLPGRRRLCKISDTSSSPCPPDDAADHHELQDVGIWEPSLGDLSHGMSPARSPALTPVPSAPRAAARYAVPGEAASPAGAHLAPRHPAAFGPMASNAVIASSSQAGPSSSAAGPSTLSMHKDSISSYITFKLDTAANNFSKWRDRFHFVLNMYNVHGHIEEASEPQHQSAKWRHEDITIVLWIYATISDDLYDVVRSPMCTAYSLWTALHTFFYDNEAGRAIHIGAEFRTAVQGDLSIAACCRNLKNLADPDPPEPQPMGTRKVKLPDRRRLCKLSDTSSSPCPTDAADHHELQDVGIWEPTGNFGGEDDDHEDEEEKYHDTYSAASAEEEEELPDFEMEAAVGNGKPPYKLPARILHKLYVHQREGLDWLWSLHCRGTGGILGDDMGLGKTMQVSAFLAGLFHSGLIRRVLVVAPKTLVTHWIKELSVVGLRHMISDYCGSRQDARDFELRNAFKEGGILLTTYTIARNNYRNIRGDFNNDVDDEVEGKLWNYVILDEAHFIKNPETQTFQSLFEIPCVHRIAISGTPIQNNLTELWALFRFCCPEVLGEKEEFKETYERPIIRGNDKSASNRAKDIGSTARKELRERIKPYFLRRKKNEVSLGTGLTDDKQLPKKDELTIWLKLTDCQRELYKAFLNCELVHLATSQGNPLSAITVLKKICDHPQLVTKRSAERILEGMDGMLNNHEMEMAEKMAMNLADMDDDDDDDAVQVDPEVSCKLTFILALLRNLLGDGHHVLIFSQTRKMLNLIQEAILLEGYDFLRMDGDTEISERERIVKDFQEGLGAQIFLLTTKVGGLGLTLTKAARVIVVDPAWNPSTDNQSVDRVYRIGQTKDVIVYRLMTSATVEEKIYKLQVLKGALFRAATEKNELTRYFSQREIHDLFSLPEQGFDVSLTQKQLQEEHGHQLDMDELLRLREHIEFLEQQGIAGVSHHSLLFSKIEVLPSESDALDRGADAKPKVERFTARTNTNSDIPEDINRLTEALAGATLESRLHECGD